VPHKLDPYKGISDARLAEFPRLSAQRLFDEVRAAGYAGGYGRVGLRALGATARAGRARGPVRHASGPPGPDGLWDVRAALGGRRHALLVVLGHSRLVWLRFYPRQTMDVAVSTPWTTAGVAQVTSVAAERTSLPPV